MVLFFAIRMMYHHSVNQQMSLKPRYLSHLSDQIITHFLSCYEMKN